MPFAAALRGEVPVGLCLVVEAVNPEGKPKSMFEGLPLFQDTPKLGL